MLVHYPSQPFLRKPKKPFPLLGKKRPQLFNRLPQRYYIETCSWFHLQTQE